MAGGTIRADERPHLAPHAGSRPCFLRHARRPCVKLDAGPGRGRGLDPEPKIGPVVRREVTSMDATRARRIKDHGPPVTGGTKNNAMTDCPDSAPFLGLSQQSSLNLLKKPSKPSRYRFRNQGSETSMTADGRSWGIQSDFLYESSDSVVPKLDSTSKG